MKILWLSTKEDNAFGVTTLCGLSEGLRKKGHDVTVILGSKRRRDKQGHIQYVKKPYGRLIFFKLKLSIYLAWKAIRNNADFVIVDWESAFVPFILLLLSRIGLYRNNLIHDIRTIPVPDNSNHSDWIFRFCVWISKHFYVGVTTITPALKNKLCRDYRVPEEKIGIWSSGVDLDIFYPRDGSVIRRRLGIEGKFVAFYHGSLGYRRGVVEVVEAVALLKERYADICFVILGDGPELKTVQKIKTEKMLDNVIIVPPVAYQNVPEYISTADVCIVPLADLECWTVSSPLKLMEYLAMGKPVILTDIPAHRSIVKNTREAFFVPDIQPDTIRAAIEKAYRMRSELPLLGNAGWRNAREYCSWDVQADRLSKFLAGLQQSVQ